MAFLVICHNGKILLITKASHPRKWPTYYHQFFPPHKMRKILTNQVCILERENHTTSDLVWKSQGFFEKRSKIIFTSRREIFTKPWLFSIIPSRFFKKLSHFFSENPEKPWKFAEKVPKSLIFAPMRIAYFRPTDLVVKNKRKIPPEKCEKFWQKIRRCPTSLGIGNTQTTEIAL